jgi:hypothetical protein
MVSTDLFLDFLQKVVVRHARVPAVGQFEPN